MTRYIAAIFPTNGSLPDRDAYSSSLESLQDGMADRLGRGWVLTSDQLTIHDDLGLYLEFAQHATMHNAGWENDSPPMERQPWCICRQAR